jgi:hypothetical protein
MLITTLSTEVPLSLEVLLLNPVGGVAQDAADRDGGGGAPGAASSPVAAAAAPWKRW